MNETLSHHQVEFKDKIVIIAGGAMGIGEALVRAFHSLGAKVVILDKSQKHADELAQDLGAKTGGLTLHKPAVIAADLSNETARLDAIRRIADDHPFPSTFISTLGYDKRISLTTHNQDDLEMHFRVNFIAPVMLAKDFIPLMRKAGGGAICLFSSHHGQHLIDIDMMGYGASKAALDNAIMRLAKYAGLDNTADNLVRVFGLRPGWVQTPNQTVRFSQSDFEKETRAQLLPVPMTANDLVPFVISLVSDRNARLLSGTILNYDAGSGQISREDNYL